MSGKWKILNSYFKGPGKYAIGEGEARIEFIVDAKGEFSPPQTKLPLYVIATRVGSRRHTADLLQRL